MERIFQNTLREYCEKDYQPWHMPGHKRNPQLASHSFGVELDVTELPGLDNLHAPEGAIAQSMEQLTAIYGSWKSYYLVNGSTAGILTAISAVCNRGDTIIMGRNCHKSVYHAVVLLELKPVYLYPEQIEPYGICNSISAKQVQEALEKHPKAKAVIFPSPTYEGILSDIRAISEVTHRYGAMLIVDEAHGAHLEFGSEAPVSAVRSGADLVIQSLHKTLPCYTQCALLHLCISSTNVMKKVDKAEGCEEEALEKKRIGILELQDRVEQYLSIYQTSSPSYLLVANMEDGIAAMEEWRSTKVMSYYKCLRRFRKKWESLQKIHLLTVEEVQQAGGFAYDESKLVFCVDGGNFSGEMLLEWLEKKQGIVLEMASLNYALAMSSASDTEESFVRLDDALQQADEMLMRFFSKGPKDEMLNKNDEQKKENKLKLEGQLQEVDQYSRDKLNGHEELQRSDELKEKGEPQKSDELKREEKVHVSDMIPGEAWKRKTRYERLTNAKGSIAGDFVTVYPPGIPVLVPGECIEEEHVAYLQKCLEKGLTVHGLVLEGSCYLMKILERNY